jgi:hypothetical protein
MAPLSVAGYQRMVARAGEAVGFPFLVHSHMLRHSCGYKLANDGQGTRAIQHYLGHKSINNPAFGNPQKSCESIYARAGKPVLGVPPSARQTLNYQGGADDQTAILSRI